MAKGKNAAALFEVIGKSKGLKPAAPRGGLDTPRWWFKGSKGAESAAPAGESGGTARSPAAAPVAAAKAEPVVKPEPMVKPERSKLGPMTALRAPTAAAAPVTEPAREQIKATHSEGAAGGGAVLLDSDRQEIRLRLTYTSAAIVVVALLATLSVAVIIGKSWGGGRQADAQQSTVDLLAGPPRPGVLQATPGQGKLDFIDADPAGLAAAPRTPQTAEGGIASRAGTDARQASEVTPGPSAGGTSAAVATGPASRVVGINYFIVQSYPDERDARAVVDLLARHGVATSIERNLPGYPRWYIVVTNQGFTSLRAPEAEALRRKIDQISADQARTDRRWKPLTPQGYRWR